MSELISDWSKIAIVILNWNGKNYLKQFLPVLVKYSNTPEIKIYIADNGSTDGSITFLQEFYPQINLIQFSENYGFTGGYNRALEQISSKYFIILNSDVEVSPNWIQPIISYMDENDGVAACQPKIKSFVNKEYFEYAGAAGGFIDKFGYPFCRGRILKEYEKDTGQYDDLREIFWATGACMFIRADLFKSVGGFDEDFFAHMEEIDLCWRLKNQAYKIMYFPESTVYHLGGGTLSNENPRKLYLNYRNNLFLLHKNLATSQLFWVLFQRLILDGISAILYLISLKFNLFWMVLRAHYQYYKKASKIHRKRNKNQPRTSQIKEIYPRSIVFDYFIKKRHYFRKLNF